MLVLTLSSCGIFTNDSYSYFITSKSGLIKILQLTRNNEKVSFIYRRTFLGTFYKLLKMQMIDYKIENYNLDLQILFQLKDNFQNEKSELRKIILNDSFECTLLDKPISFESALSNLQLSKEELNTIFDIMIDLDIISISRLKENSNSFAFLIKDKFYFIYSENIEKLNLERNIELKKLDENWYYYDGVL